MIHLEIQELIDKYSSVFKNINRRVEFSPGEKWKKNTLAGEVLIKEGAVVPQAKEKVAQEYLDDLLQRVVIRHSNSASINPIRFIQKPDGSLRLVSNFMPLKDIVVKV